MEAGGEGEAADGAAFPKPAGGAADSLYGYWERVRAGAKQRAASQAHAAGSGAAPAYTPEQEKQARAILKQPTLFHVLGVERGVSEGDLRRSYRRLALAVHPDKCAAPSANAAFQRVSVAYDTLSDTGKRLAYEWELDHPASSGGAAGGGGSAAPRAKHGSFHSAAAAHFTTSEAEARATDAVRFFGVSQRPPFRGPPAEWFGTDAPFWQLLGFCGWHAALLLCFIGMLLARVVLVWGVRQCRDFLSWQYVRIDVPSLVVEFWVTLRGRKYAAFNNVVREIDDEEFMNIIMDLETLVHVMRQFDEVERQRNGRGAARGDGDGHDTPTGKPNRQQKRRMERAAKTNTKKKRRGRR